MERLRSLGLFAPVSWRRVGRAALLALQLGFGLSPLVERWDPVRPVAHAHEQGTRHLFAHDDSTCVLCAVRTMAAEAPAEPGFLLSAAARRDAAPEAPTLLPTWASDPTNPSRAPPVLS